MEKKKVLFVDDETRILDGLRRLLRGQRSEWDMTFVDSAAEALRVLEATAFDVLVTDMRMPGMDGAQLLAEAQRICPGAVRLVLSGHTELEGALRAVPVAHQFLSKPCDTNELRDTVERVWDFSHSLKGADHTQLAGTLGALPVAPRVRVRLREICTRDDVAFEEVASIIEEDPAYATKVLQLVNSSFFGLRRQIHSVSDAARQLGMDVLRNLVVNDELCRSFEAPVARGYDLDEAQHHGFLASRLASRFVSDPETRETARCAALVHDVGQTLFASRLPEEYARVLELQTSGMSRHDAEREVFEITHAEIGAYLLGLWGLPTPIVEAVLFHHEPSRAGDRFGAAGAVHVASALAHGDESRLDHDYLRAAGVDGLLDEWRAILAEESSDRHGRMAA